MRERVQHLHGPSGGWPSRVYLQREYGGRIVVNRVGKINLIHLDRPSQATIKKRIEKVIQEEVTGEKKQEVCPLCRNRTDHPYDVIYYDPAG